ncbi:hypothetical protein L3Q82_015524 [Scortum barcoo]|uniref:Uncharacterized protein n=1 Tax=Scortum barcoo TaxID=214431 RepID=A0ACB8VQ05_9TELE|nr:hypothetical protein L3Q82_015524 [Scortum barcoo]
MSLSEKSHEEISDLLTKFGIKHGPIVDSTRKLYEKKLEKAMKDAPVTPSSDKTYYREEEEEVTYITYHSPVSPDIRVYPCRLKRRGHAEPEEDDEESDQDTEPPIQIANRTANHSAVRAREPVRQSGGGCLWRLWRLIRLLLLFAALAAAVYYYILSRDKQ